MEVMTKTTPTLGRGLGLCLLGAASSHTLVSLLPPGC